MQLEKLRIIGFKTFVDPVDVPIAAGLTGIVGPNGCGKSNLVEALRWVMGETSHRSLRGAGMDDVIFAGGGGRPARHAAEVVLRIDNSARMAPAAFNDVDTLEISRKIVREQGSTYRVNGREVRARDVQILFADAATGARSPAMVRQGQIGELITAKPQLRRRILEDAAGIAGLHARRHEAELRLKQAEDNLARVDDLIGHLSGQIDGLARQARQAERYRALAAQIRATETALARRNLVDARTAEREADAAVDRAVLSVAQATATQGEAERARAVAVETLETARRHAEAARAQAQAIGHKRAETAAAIAQTQARLDELARRIGELSADIERAERAATEAEAEAARHQAEAERLAAEEADLPEDGAAAEAAVKARAMLAAAETALADIQATIAAAAAEKNAAARALTEATERERRAAQACAAAAAAKAAFDAEADTEAMLSAAQQVLEEAETRRAKASGARGEAERALGDARDGEAAAGGALAPLDARLSSQKGERRALASLVAPESGTRSRVLDALTVAPGYEIALGAALGDDLEAGLDEAGALRWAAPAAMLGAPSPLPEGTRPLADFVAGPEALRPRLEAIAVTDGAEGAATLAAHLRIGQRLVTRAGDFWRWDGLAARAGAPTSAVRRLEARNRLAALDRLIAATEADRARARAALEDARAMTTLAAKAAGEARQSESQARSEAERAQKALGAAMQRHAERAGRRGTLAEALAGATERQSEAARMREAAESALAAFATLRMEALEADRATHQGAAAQCRAQVLAAEAELAGIRARRDDHRRRRDRSVADAATWAERAKRDRAQGADLLRRRQDATGEQVHLADQPAQLQAALRALSAAFDAAEQAARNAADAGEQAATAAAAAERTARAALQALLEAREARARAETAREAARARREEAARAFTEAHGTNTEPPSAEETGTEHRRDLAQAEDLGAGNHEAEADSLAPSGEIAQTLAALVRERDRLGPVNLRSPEELRDVAQARDRLGAEKDEITQACAKYRRAIDLLNREGRERLLAAFDVVHGHFQRLFARLFGGGSAELRLIESDDPLEAGLEIFAKPPGKSPSVLTLLSGGEQALTATALIFAIFLTNPSPICVLDEVDAPLDDANVERLCELLHEMARETRTRFVVITHNPISMARMDRLFGVTMMEKGISQFVSVDLKRAETLVAVG